LFCADCVVICVFGWRRMLQLSSFNSLIEKLLVDGMVFLASLWYDAFRLSEVFQWLVFRENGVFLSLEFSSSLLFQRISRSLNVTCTFFFDQYISTLIYKSNGVILALPLLLFSHFCFNLFWSSIFPLLVCSFSSGLKWSLIFSKLFWLCVLFRNSN
jgi:hypothetical protein